MKVMTVVGTRPELIKLSRVIALLDQEVHHIFVHTGQNYTYELNGIFFEDLGIRKPDHFLDAATGTACETVGQIIAKIDALIRREKPDAFLILGDTNSCIAVYAAKRHQIPIFHMEAGNRCFDQRVPEEINRTLIDHASDINMVYTEHARRYLLQEGLPGERIFKTGSPMKEIYQAHMPKIEQSDVLSRLGVHAQQYFVASIHREENVDYGDNLSRLLNSLEYIYEKFGFPVIVSTHPRTQKRLEENPRVLSKNIQFLPALGFTDYVHLQCHAFCTISDSGSITEEASILGFPAVMVRQTHERPEGMDEATVIMAGLDPDHIVDSIRIVTSTPRNPRVSRIVADYDTEIVSHKVLRIIMSYTDYINRVVWRKAEGARLAPCVHRKLDVETT